MHSMSVEYYAHVEQKGEGCDYTIGCGHAFVHIIGAKSMEAAHAFILHEYQESIRDGEVEHIHIYEVSKSSSLDIPALERLMKAKGKEAEAQKKEAAERAEFERLKTKFGQ